MKMLKLKYKDRVIEDINPGTSLYEISQFVKKDYKFPILGARLDNLDVDLHTLVNENGTVEFYDRSSKTGNSIYGRSLEFLVTVAVKKINNELEVLINYSLDNGIYCEIIGDKINKDFISKLNITMKEIIAGEIHFTKCKVLRLDAIKHFKKTNQLDKVKNLKYSSNTTVDLYKLGNIYDYFFGPLIYDTSQIDEFNLLYLNQNSFVISYPTVNDPEKTPKYNHHDKIFDKYQEYKTWGETINIDIVAQLNEIGTMGRYAEAVDVFETFYNQQLSNIAEQIYKKKDKVQLILLSGPSSSGKTTTSKKLIMYLKAKGINVYQISLDNYFVDRTKTPKDENGEYDYANIKATDIDLFNKHLEKLFAGEKVNMPTYDFIKGKKVYNDNYLKLWNKAVILVEGIHTLNDKLTPNIKRENKFKIYVTPIVQLKIDNHNRVRTTDLRKIRRIVRDSRVRGYSAEETLKIWDNVDKETYECIYPYQDDADAVINTALSYEMGVLRIFAEPLLYGINQNSEVYSEAIRLAQLLRQFMPISSEIVPKDSILREFIG